MLRRSVGKAHLVAMAAVLSLAACGGGATKPDGGGGKDGSSATGGSDGGGGRGGSSAAGGAGGGSGSGGSSGDAGRGDGGGSGQAGAGGAVDSGAPDATGTSSADASADARAEAAGTGGAGGNLDGGGNDGRDGAPTGTGGASGSGGSGDAGTGPIAGTGSRLVVPGVALLVGNGANSCTNQVPASGDRWCAFARPGAFLGFIDLFVLNVSKAAAGTTVRCDGGDANCVRLTTDLFIDPSLGIGIHGFDGDTLIYYAETGPMATATSGFFGPVYAWRPGWEGGRKLTGDSGVVCFGHPKATTALCFDNLLQTGPTGAACTFSTATDCRATYDFHAGPLPTAPGAPALPKIETMLVQWNQDPAGVTKFEFDFSPDGGSVAWSARATTTGPEILKVQRLGDTTPITVASDVSQWQISSDGGAWYWLKTFNYSTTAPLGTLQTADFPAGTTPTQLAPAVAEHFAAGPRGVMFRDGLVQGKGNLKLIADRATPNPVSLDTGVLGLVQISQDGTRALYAKTATGAGATLRADLFEAAASGRCTLSAAVTAAPNGSFLASGGGTVWASFNAAGSANGFFTNLAGCTSSMFASNILLWVPVADEGFIYGDDSVSGTEITLRYSKMTGGALPTGTVIQTRADPTFASLLPAIPGVFYAVLANSPQDGIYINATLPFTPTN